MKRMVVVELEDCSREFNEDGDLFLKCPEINLEAQLGLDELEVIRDNDIDEYFRYGISEEPCEEDVLLLITPRDAGELIEWWYEQ